jgi:2-oxoglutarate dehydrogenase E2 component (dihydrolipoamide succinyltransferase)
MAIELKVPSAGESITEVTIVEWVKPEGAFAQPDETVALIETDKANVELPAPVRGRVTRILKRAGEVAAVGEVIGLMEEGEASAVAPAATASGAPAKVEAAAPAPAKVEAAAPAPAKVEAAPVSNGAAVAERAAPPSARRAMREGKLEARPSAPEPRRAPAPRPRAPSVPGRAYERVPMTPLRRRIAERLVEAQSTAAMLTTFNEVDMGAVMELRKQHQDAFVARHGVKLGLMSFFVKAAIEALKAFPAVNAEIDGDALVYNDYYDIGVAVGGGRGLVVPVIRNAERLSFAELEKAIADFGARAKDGKLKVEELQGGTFTISNGGVYGSLLSTPILNTPQSGILGMHAIQERPVVKNGQLAVAKMMYLALTYDHRIIDGREAVSFLIRIKELLENPARLLLEV